MIQCDIRASVLMFCTEKVRRHFNLLAIFCCLLGASEVFALEYPLASDQEVVGEVHTAKLRAKQSLMSVAQHYNLGYYEVLEANPTVSPKLATADTELLMPTEFILPDAERVGVVLNTAELRVYVYPEDKNQVITLPAGIGRFGWETPLGEAEIKDKRKNPFWTVPESVYLDMKRRGVIIPRKWPPGPKNPLGKYAMRITILSLIHI